MGILNSGVASGELKTAEAYAFFKSGFIFTDTASQVDIENGCVHMSESGITYIHNQLEKGFWKTNL